MASILCVLPSVSAQPGHGMSHWEAFFLVLSGDTSCCAVSDGAPAVAAGLPSAVSQGATSSLMSQVRSGIHP